MKKLTKFEKISIVVWIFLGIVIWSLYGKIAEINRQNKTYLCTVSAKVDALVESGLDLDIYLNSLDFRFKYTDECYKLFKDF